MFRDHVDEYLRRSLRKGVPSLFTSLKPLYTDSSKVSMIQQLTTTYYRTLIDKQLFHPEGNNSIFLEYLKVNHACCSFCFIRKCFEK